MTEGSPPTNFSSTFQSAARKKERSCVSVMHVVSAMAACQSFSLLLQFITSFLKIFLKPPRKKSVDVLISFFHIHETLTGSLIPIDTLYCRAEVIFFRQAQILNQPPNQGTCHSAWFLLWWSAWNNVCTGGCSLPPISCSWAPSEVSSRSCSTQNICCIFQRI